MNYPKSIKSLIECYKKLPGVGEKSAERMALATLLLEQETLDIFSTAIKEIKEKTKRCVICNNFSDNEICDICSSKERNKKIICVVEEPKNVILFEHVGSYDGLYHVLDGLISPLDGITPDKINIDSLIKRIEKEKPNELIFALKPSIEGETTILYISKLLEQYDITISKIAHGVPMGAEIDYLDSLTLEMALEDRKKLSNN